VLKCALHPRIAKILLKIFFGGLRSFKVINVDKSKKPVISACYDKQFFYLPRIYVCVFVSVFCVCNFVLFVFAMGRVA